jgi:hypothetical protein
MHRAVHRLQVVVLTLPLQAAICMPLFIDVHRRIHQVTVEAKVPRDREQFRLADVRGVDELIAGLDVALPGVVLHDLAQQPTFGMEDRKAGADLVRERIQVELGTKFAVITLRRLGQPGLVRLQLLAAGPRRAVEALKLIVPLITAPVRRGVPGERKGRDVAGVRHVWTAAQVLPGNRIIASQVVIDRQLTNAHLSARFVILASRGLVGDQFQLVRLGGELGARPVVAHRATAEALPLLDDLGHRFLDITKIIRGERRCHVEVVIEAIGDRRPDSELGFGVQ